MLSRSLLSRGALSATTLAAVRSPCQAAVPRALPWQAVPSGLLCIARGAKVVGRSLGALRERTGAGLGWTAMAREGARCIISTGPLLKKKDAEEDEVCIRGTPPRTPCCRTAPPVGSASAAS